MKRILLINPPFQEQIKAVAQQSTGQPLGILSVASVLKKSGFRVMVYDFNAAGYSDKKCAELLRDFRPHAVGMTATTPTISVCDSILKKIKNFDPSIITVLGGPHPTLLPEETLKNTGVDYVACGEGEQLCESLFNTVLYNKLPDEIPGTGYKIKDNVFVTPAGELCSNLSQFPWPARECVNQYFYQNTDSTRFSTMIAMRGCPAQCIYCSVPLYFGRRIRHRKPIDVADEMESLYIRYGTDCIGFVDDTFTYNEDWVEEFCNILIKRNIPVKWSCLSRADTLNQRILKKMKRAGLYKIEIGIESGSPRVRNILKKNISEQQILRAFGAAKKLSLMTMAFFILNIPGETEEDIMQSMELLRKADPDFVQISFATPYPASPLYDMAEKLQLIKHTEFKNYRFLNEIVLKNPDISECRLRKLHRAMLIKFYLRPSYIWRIFRYVLSGKLDRKTVFKAGVYSVKRILFK